MIDAGISCRETEERLRQLGLSISAVRAIFISHEHGDHIKGLITLSVKHKIPVYVSADTARYIPGFSRDEKFSFTADEPVKIGTLNITAFNKNHDAADPYSFIISSGTISIGVFTDIGNVCKQVRKYFSLCHAAFLEANYDEDMLEKGRYPVHLKNRIRGGKGHLSNRQALELFMSHRPPFMTDLILSHLSAENNHPELAEKYFAPHAMGAAIRVASRYKAMQLITVAGDRFVQQPAIRTVSKVSQLELF